VTNNGATFAASGSSSGFTGALRANDQSVVNISGGSLHASMSTGGFVTDTAIRIAGAGQFHGDRQSGDFAAQISSGGFVTDTAIGLNVLGNSTVTVNGGNFAASISSGGFSSNLASGLLASDDSTVSIFGGNFAGDNEIGGLLDPSGNAIMAPGSAKVSIFGGTFTIIDPILFPTGVDLVAQDTAQMTLFGGGFNYPLGPIADLSGVLTGTLQSGQPVSLRFLQSEPGQIQLSPVPEPTMVLPLSLLMLAPLRGRTRRS
jgi:hypothetical protein